MAGPAWLPLIQERKLTFGGAMLDLPLRRATGGGQGVLLLLGLLLGAAAWDAAAVSPACCKNPNQPAEHCAFLWLGCSVARRTAALLATRPESPLTACMAAARRPRRGGGCRQQDSGLPGGRQRRAC
jgi:hypothetical protein